MKKIEKKEFWIIEEGNIGDFENNVRKQYECEGPFSSLEEAKRELRESCSDSFRSAELDNLEKETYEDYCSKFKIVQTLETIHPVPVVDIKTKLKRI
jgi:hypothetical protein